MIVAQQNLAYPLNATHAIELYIKLRQEARTWIGIWNKYGWNTFVVMLLDKHICNSSTPLSPDV